MVLFNLPPLVRSKPIMLLLLYSANILNDVTDDFKYGTDHSDLYNVYDFIIGKANKLFSYYHNWLVSL